MAMTTVILTHERTDFDAAASVLAMYKLDPQAKPVLPGRIRQDVQQFLTLYGGQLPFLQHKDIRGPIAQVIVVDTQTFSRVKGIKKNTPVTIYDHHELEPDNPAHWDVSIEKIGANVSWIVEMLREADVKITSVEATLMLLGIYTDTGSLQYGSTTPRDVYAAGWLLEQGALLDVVRNYLNTPFDENQRHLYDQLQHAAGIVVVGGYNILFSEAVAQEDGIEMARLAQRLSELYDPAAVIILVQFSGHVQLVARSTVDAVNVDTICEDFGGGGHPRAAAARLTGYDLNQAYDQVLAATQEHITPALTVADLMSHGVRTFPPDIRADQAADYMSRHGYEGYPVVNEGAVVGLITRREVDRAIGHRLHGVFVEQLMRAGSVSVTPESTLNQLQTLMVDSGWGQIPVLDESNKLIGIVTRTDLIRHIGREAHPANEVQNVISQLEEALPPVVIDLMREVGRTTDQHNFNVFLVGGFVRDLMLGVPNLDLDFIVEGDATLLAEDFSNKFGGYTEVHERFGTFKWHTHHDVWSRIAEVLGSKIVAEEMLPLHVDFATARTEYYAEPSALPEVEQSSIKLDLHRRDFTINTMTIRLNPQHFGELYDPYEGIKDLSEQSIRVLHPLSFIDDPTRMFRAVRFAQRLNFRIEPRTLSLLRLEADEVKRLTGDRIRHELDLMFNEKDPEKHLRRLASLGILDAVHHAFDVDDWTEAAFKAARLAHEAVRWDELADVKLDYVYYGILVYRLSPDVAEAVCDRLNLGRRHTNNVLQAQVVRTEADTLLKGVASETVVVLNDLSDTSLLIGWAATIDQTVRSQIEAFAKTLRHIQPNTTGETLKSLGLEPGPHFREILQGLRTARLDGQVTTDDEEIVLRDKLVARYAGR